MLESWNTVTITQIKLAIYVQPGTGKTQHTNRPSHGFVINDTDACREYRFSDGTVLRTKGRSVFYLPMGSSYQMKVIGDPCGCWAINFLTEEEIREKPFVLNFKNSDGVLEDFKEAVSAFKSSNENAALIIKRNLYNIILRIKKESEKKYIPSAKRQLIQPAVEQIHQRFTDRNLTVGALAKTCNMSENYLRRIFGQEFGMSPKAYIIQHRIEYAKALMSDGRFSITQIAEMCGYFEPCHFSREFSRYTGIAPTKYAKEAARE